MKAEPMPLCPSAQPEMEGSVIFGVVGGSVEQPRVGYLTEPRPFAGEPLTRSLPVHPTEVFRLAAPAPAAPAGISTERTVNLQPARSSCFRS
jgi:hypothetical protein